MRLPAMPECETLDVPIVRRPKNDAEIRRRAAIRACGHCGSSPTGKLEIERNAVSVPPARCDHRRLCNSEQCVGESASGRKDLP